MSDIVWRDLTRAELDAGYDNTAAVKNSAEKLAEWQDRSERVRAARPELLDQPYGPRPRNKIDIFRCGEVGAALFAYVHGGYWQRNAKEFYACLAEGPLARGIDCAMIGYTLAPAATLTEIVGEVRSALRWLRAQGRRLGVAKDKLILSGWSAGGHLTAMALADADAGLAISGIYDIEPCRLNYLNEKLNLTPREVLELSPIKQLPAHSPPLIVAYGTAELPELQRQSRDYHAARRAARLPSDLLALEGHDHFSILEELAGSSGRLTTALARLTETN
ncbi:MAG: alpha/beta hydrolase [Bradyrhizobiaceae bacterium]|nr:alpha/beta hydrolase [Bradyrhizobiaceae bacterium]